MYIYACMYLLEIIIDLPFGFPINNIISLYVYVYIYIYIYTYIYMCVCICIYIYT